LTGNFVVQDNSVVVADFGLARITSEMSLLQDRYRASSKRGRRVERKKRYLSTMLKLLVLIGI